MSEIKMSELAKQLHMEAVSKGFWDRCKQEDDGVSINGGDVMTHYAKMHGELSEALEEHRSGRPAVYVLDIEGEQPRYETDISRFAGRKPEGWCVELADFVMMALDRLTLEHCADEDLDEGYARLRADTKLGVALVLLSAQTETMRTLLSLILSAHHKLDEIEVLELSDKDEVSLLLMIALIDVHVEAWGYDLKELMQLKLEYNKTRERLHGKLY